MPIKKKVCRYHVEGAAKIWREQPGYGGFRESIKYDVIIKGKAYPPKAIVAISNELAGLPLMRHSDFSGVKDGKWHTMLKDLDFRIVLKGVIATEHHEIGQSASIDADIDAIDEKHRTNPTMRSTLIMARIGQGKFRQELLALWDGQCAVTGCCERQVLRASHAKPWSKSDDEERLDPNNGLPLVATLDALFDAGLIGFDERGKMHVSAKLKDSSLLEHIPRTLRKKPTIRQAEFLKSHLYSVFNQLD